MAMGPQSVGVYCRLSYAEDGSEEKCDRQEADSRQLADRLVWPISEAHVFRDNNRSAWQRNRKRPGWDAMLKAIRDGEIDGIIVYHGDRLLRQPRDLEDLLSIAESKGIRVASVSGTRNLDNADDRYILRIEAAGFCRASDDASRRIKRANKELAEKGLPRPGGTRAFGFERDNLTHRKSETRFQVEVVDRLFAGQTQYGARKWLNSVTTTSTGRPWSATTFKSMLRSSRIAGLMWRDGELVEAAWDPIISVEAWYELAALLDAKKEALAPYEIKNEHVIKYLLTGIARCGTCGGSMGMQAQRATNKAGTTRMSYLCASSSCPYRIGRSLPNLDAYIIGRTLRRLNDPVFVNAVYANLDQPGVGAEIAELERRKAKAKAQLENLAEYPEIDVGLVATSLGSFDRKIEKLRTGRAASMRQRLLARVVGISREQWDDLPLDIRRSVISALFKITVLPATWKGNGFDPASVRVKRVGEEE